MNVHHGLSGLLDVHAGVKDADCEMSAWVREMSLESANYMQLCCVVNLLRVEYVQNDDDRPRLSLHLQKEGRDAGCGMRHMLISEDMVVIRRR